MDISKLIKLHPGYYVIAVSGGVDSMVLMHLLSVHHHNKASGVKFTVAHFDHGIRDDSHIDRALVGEEATRLRLPFVYAEGALGPDANEESARDARYAFLNSVRDRVGARAIITAHHHDDVVETAVLNIMRGTGRKGLSSLKSRHDVLRPLLHVPKSRLKAYAQANGLVWHDDSTNTDEKYRRNYIRHSVLGKLKQQSPKDYDKLIKLLRRQHELNQAIDQNLDVLLHIQPGRTTIRRQDIISLPYTVAKELVAEWLRSNGKRLLSKWLVDRTTIAIRTAQPNTEFLLDSRSKISFGKHNVEFVSII
ncbi:tRNA lysidine(34) synthetase TilS [Candidatus Saccharibacteria bacterium]|nr:tRNA lysidine(34) synthetase TilS [Candidatus Saccharibacteria bacterium]